MYETDSEEEEDPVPKTSTLSRPERNSPKEDHTKEKESPPAPIDDLQWDPLIVNREMVISATDIERVQTEDEAHGKMRAVVEEEIGRFRTEWEEKM